LANTGHDRSGPDVAQETRVRYTEWALERFKDFWRQRRLAMGWSMDRRGIRTLFDHKSKRLKQVELSGPRRERVSLDTYSDELAAREVEFRQSQIRQVVRTRITALNTALASDSFFSSLPADRVGFGRRD
jgi:hypothetical protein